MKTRRLTAQELIDLPQWAKVVVVVDDYDVSAGDFLYRHRDPGYDDLRSCYFSTQPDHPYGCIFMTYEEVDLVIEEAPEEQPTLAFSVGDVVPKVPELGVYRPELSDRKVGKVRVELVDDGFPLALREIAKVMTWAQEAKGYKDHDWQNLPNAELQLAAAASRHRTDHIKQRVVDGLAIDQCVDGESSLLHKAHEAFGVLAQLELMLRGEFK